MTQTAARRRLPVAIRRRRILESAERLISGRGYYGLPLAEIAEDCGLTNAGLLHYFKSKAALLIAVLAERDTLDFEYITSTMSVEPSKEVACAELHRLVERNATQREVVRLYTVLSAEALDPSHPAHDFFLLRLQYARKVLSDVSKAWHPNPSRFADQVLAVMDGLQLNWLRDERIDFVHEWDLISERLFDV